MTRFGILTTTIHLPKLLEKYAQNFCYYKHKDVFFVVIGDKKTPDTVGAFCQNLEAKYGFKVIYHNVADQIKYLERFPALAEHIPWNSIQRRNIGLLIAYEEKADIIVTIDDDNLVTNQDFLGISGHGIVGTDAVLSAFESSSGWLNVCDFLKEDKNIRFYHRGYPLEQRWNEKEHFITSESLTGRVVVNAGFWQDDPDIDAITRMVNKIIVRGLNKTFTSNFTLYFGTWSPFNSQNTALSRTVLPAYFLSPYIGRYDDIWASYILRRIMDHLGDFGTFGLPLVRQFRNPHDLFVDLAKEIDCMEITNDFCQFLRETELGGRTYLDCFSEVAEALTRFSSSENKKVISKKSLIMKLSEGMNIWSNIFNEL